MGGGPWADDTAGDEEPFHKGRSLQMGGEKLNTGLFPNTLSDHGKQPGRGFAGVQPRPVLGGGCVFLALGNV